MHGGTLHSAQAILYGATITVDDPVAPAVGPASGSLLSGGWLRGAHTAQISGSDATGLSEFQVVRDGSEPVGRQALTCDYGRMAPCQSPGQTIASSLPAVDTSAWSDGVHSVALRAVDAAGNSADSPAVEVRTDNTAPGAPANVRNGRGAVWAKRRTQTIRWQAPAGQAAPINASNVSACRGKKKLECVTVAASGPAGATLRLPRQRLYRGSVYLVDAAGNVSAANAAPFSIGYDEGRPRRPRLALGGRRKRLRSVRVRIKDRGPAPLARLAARLCKPRSTKRCRTVRASGLKRIRARPARGRSVLRVRVVDAAGNRSREARIRLR